MENALDRPRAAVATPDLLPPGADLPTSAAWASLRRPLVDEPFAPNEVIVWNRILLLLLHGEPVGPAARAVSQLAAMHLAVADAIAALGGRHSPYAFAPGRSRAGSQGVAAAAAAHAVLAALYPRRRGLIDRELAVSLRSIPGGSVQRLARSIGGAAAAVVLGECRRDPVWMDAGLGPLLEPPFVADAASHLDAAPPPAATSETFLADLAEVRSVGARASSNRLPLQTDTAAFWAAPSWARWNEAAQVSSVINHNSVAADGRLFALLNVALADADWVVGRAKRAYDLQRPEAVIHASGDPRWTPLAITPASPSYPSLRSAQSTAAAIVLEQEFGNRFGLELPAPSVPGSARRYRSFRAAAAEAGVGAIYAGAHYRFDHVEGERLGLATARYVTESVLRPSGRA
jgi:hypothetical protein